MATGQLDQIDLDIGLLKERIAELEHERDSVLGEIKRLEDRAAGLRELDVDLTMELRARRAAGR